MIQRTCVLLLAALIALPAAASAESAPTVGRWAISSNRQDDAGKVSLLLVYERSDSHGSASSTWQNDVALSEVGLSADRLAAPIAPYAFKIARDAGTFDCVGTAGGGLGAGQYTFAQNTGFGDTLAARGIGRPTLDQSITLAMAGTTMGFIDDLSKGGTKPTIDSVVRLAQHGIGPRYVAELAGAGYRVTDADSLLRMRDHGVNAAFVAELAKRGYTKLSIEDLTRMRDHGITVAYIDRLQAHGYKKLPVNDLIRLRDSGL